MSEETTDAALAALAQAIAPKLPGEWKFTEGGYRHTAHIADPAGRTFWIGTNGDRGKLNVRGIYPRCASGHGGGTFADGLVGSHSEFGEWPGISVSESRGADAIAKDIARRFLPDFAKLWERADERRRNSEAHERLTADTAAEVARIAGSAVGGHDAYQKRVQIGKHDGKAPNGEATITGARVDLKLSDLTAEEVRAILATFAK